MEVNISALACFIHQSFYSEKNVLTEDLPTRDVVQSLRMFKNEFASEVAVTVCDRNEMSEKQARVLAIGIANNQEKFKSFLMVLPSDCFIWNEINENPE